MPLGIIVREVDKTFFDPLGFRTRLEELFSEVCSDPRTPATMRSFWVLHALGPGRTFDADPDKGEDHGLRSDAIIGVLPSDLVIYIVPTQSRSVIKARYGVNPPGADFGGSAYVRGKYGNISEIYTDYEGITSGSDAADLAFHELMHNKLQMGDEMHSMEGDLGLGRAVLGTSFFGNRLGPGDLRRLCPALASNVPQCTNADRYLK